MPFENKNKNKKTAGRLKQYETLNHTLLLLSSEMVLNASSDAEHSEPVFLNSLKQKHRLQSSCSWVSWETEILHSKCEAHSRLSAFLRGKASTEPL